jgi:hypothetical protein
VLAAEQITTALFQAQSQGGLLARFRQGAPPRVAEDGSSLASPCAGFPLDGAPSCRPHLATHAVHMDELPQIGVESIHRPCRVLSTPHAIWNCMSTATAEPSSRSSRWSGVTLPSSVAAADAGLSGGQVARAEVRPPGGRREPRLRLPDLLPIGRDLAPQPSSRSHRLTHRGSGPGCVVLRNSHAISVAARCVAARRSMKRSRTGS